MVIPVRDEAAYIGPCLESVLASDPPPLEVVVVDDGSEDETWETVEAIAREDPRVRLVEGTDPPDGWAGKPWACQRGAGETAGDFVLFIDADVRLEPWALGEASRRMATHGLEMLSWVGDIEYPDHLSQSVGPLVDWFLRGTIDLEAANDRGRPEGMARGAFLMVLHSVYDEVGGHAGVRDPQPDFTLIPKRRVACARLGVERNELPERGEKDSGRVGCGSDTSTARPGKDGIPRSHNVESADARGA